MKDKKILLGITGSIAAYKAAYLVRALVKAGAEVKVIMTQASIEFISPLTLSTLSKNDVHIEFMEDDSWSNHVELGLWADAMVVAPATANTIAKMANGICDNLLLASYLSAKCPVFFAPAMDLDMWAHPATQRNVRLLQEYGNYLINVGTGELASGLEGEGRLAEPEEIVAQLEGFLKKNESSTSQGTLSGKEVLVTGGPTYEPIDPVRYIGNHSSGKMGMYIALAFAEAGAKVTLVMGPSDLKAYHPNVEQVDVTTAEEMYNACMDRSDQYHIAVLAAAVADYTPVNKADKKIKKTGNDGMNIELEQTHDILATLGSKKTSEQILVGFALETDNELANANKKLESKNLDLIILNSLADEGAGFGHDTNKVAMIERNGNTTKFDLKSKTEVASDIVSKISEFAHA